MVVGRAALPPPRSELGPSPDRPPRTPTVRVAEESHGVTVLDPYRWLERPASDRPRLGSDEPLQINAVSVSPDNKKLLIRYLERSGDWETAVVLDLETKELLDDRMSGLKFSTVSWLGNDRVILSRHDTPPDQRPL